MRTRGRQRTPRYRHAWASRGLTFKRRGVLAARISREDQALAYARVMGFEARQRQWRGSSGILYSVRTRLERERPPRVGLLRPVARRA